jgi:hypothetical protein
MKTLVTALTATVLLVGVGAANALDQQSTPAEIDNAQNHEFTASGPYASARIPDRVSRADRMTWTTRESRAQNAFQEQGSN